MDRREREIGTRAGERASPPSLDVASGGLPAQRTSYPIATATRSRRPFVAGLVVGIAGTLVGLAVALRTIDAPAASGGGDAWDVELTAAGAEPVIALVFGKETGVHLVRVPAREDALHAPRQIRATLGAGDVYMMSLGRAALEVRSSSADASPMSVAAEGRFVQMFHRPAGTGIRTSWW